MTAGYFLFLSSDEIRISEDVYIFALKHVLAVKFRSYMCTLTICHGHYLGLYLSRIHAKNAKDRGIKMCFKVPYFLGSVIFTFPEV